MLSRRNFIAGSAVLVGAAAVSGRAQAAAIPEAPTMASTAMQPPIPPSHGQEYQPTVTLNGWTLPWRMNGDWKEFHLVAEPVVREIAPGMKANLWGYNGQTPGPTIEGVEGDKIRILDINTPETSSPGCDREYALGKQATEVETHSGWRERFDAVASNADIMHSYKDLLSGSKRGADYSRSLSRKSFSPSLFVVHFGIEGSWPGIPHHMILFGPRYKGLLDDIYDHGVLPQDFSIYLHHPTVTDPSMAPEGMSTFYALVPVAHMGKLAVDWEEMGPLLEKRILDELERRLIPDIHSRIVTKFHYAPRDFAMDLNAHMGSAFSLEPVLTQSAWFRGHNRDDVIDNFYLVGAGTHPGAGIPGVVGSAKATAGLMIEDLAK